MSWNHIFINSVLACFLLFLNGKLGYIQGQHKDLFKYGKFTFESNTETDFSGNFFQKIVNPTIFLAVSCAVLQHFSLEAIAVDLWLLVPFYWVLRIGFYIIKNLFPFVNWKYEGYSFLASMVLSEGTLFLLIRPLIEDGESVFLDATEFRDAFWFALIAYLAKLFWDLSKHHFQGKNVFPDSKRRRIISTRYHKFSKRFGTHVDETITNLCSFKNTTQENHFKCLLYAIMIYEDYCRPPLVRALEYCMKVFCFKKELSLGIMQFKTTKIISNKKSIVLAIDKLYSCYAKETSIPSSVCSAISTYNRGSEYFTEVEALYEHLVNITEIDK